MGQGVVQEGAFERGDLRDCCSVLGPEQALPQRLTNTKSHRQPAAPPVHKLGWASSDPGLCVHRRRTREGHAHTPSSVASYTAPLRAFPLEGMRRQILSKPPSFPTPMHQPHETRGSATLEHCLAVHPMP